MLRVIKQGAPAENAAAEALRGLILQSWPDVEASPHCDIRIITGVYLSRQKVEDLDLVLLAVFEQPREIPLIDERVVVGSYLLGSLCAVIEVKGHRYDSAEVRAGTLWVSYNGEQKNVTKQNRDQMHSLAEFLSAAGAGRPHVTRFIWLQNVNASELRQSGASGPLPHEIILKDSSWLDVLTSIWRGWRGRHPEARGLGNNCYFISADINRSTPADFNRISQLLTKEEMLLRPFSYDDLPARPTALQNQYATSYPGPARRPRSSQSLFSVGKALAVGLMIVTLGVAVAIIAPRLIVWNRQEYAMRQRKEALDSYVGSYRCSPNSETYAVTNEGDRLALKSKSRSNELMTTARDEFKTLGTGNGFKGTLRFTRTPEGKVTGMLLAPDRGIKRTCSRLE